MSLHRELRLHPASLATGLLIVALIGASACSRQQPSNSVASAPPAPLVTAPGADDRTEEDVLTATTRAGGIPARYRAIFAKDRLQRIIETRGTSTTHRPGAEYEFYDARLTRYAGTVPGANAIIELEFDLHGAVIAAHSDSGEVSPEAINAIRTRAQLLRSQALAQRAVRGHGEE